MSKLEEMWAALTAYQPQADAAGHGDSWAKMCKEKTAKAADTAATAAGAYAAAAAYAAADAAAYAASYVAFDAAEKWARVAIDHINKALKEKNNG